MNLDVGKALQLQELDRTITELRGEIASLPKQIAEIDRTLGGRLKKLEADKGGLAANARARQKLDNDGKDIHQKIAKLKDQMLSAKTNEQYRAFQKEIEYCEAEIRKSEDQALQLMDDAEGLSTNVKSTEAALADEKKSVDERKKEVAALTDENKAKLAKLLAERAALTATIAKSVLASYERLRKRVRDGKVVATVEEGTCMGCNMTIRPQYLADLKLGSEVLACESCHRLLYIEPAPVDVEAEIQG
jgi:predicted  nucleic acid-binding Zn-ribbon protein